MDAVGLSLNEQHLVIALLANTAHGIESQADNDADGNGDDHDHENQYCCIVLVLQQLC